MASEEEARTNENETIDSLFDVSGVETKNTTEFLKGYCLYKHIAQRFLSSPTIEGVEKTVLKHLKEKSKSNHDFSLSLLKTDLKTEQEAKLQDFLIKRLSRSTFYYGTGNLATLSTKDISDNPVTCYYKLIKGTKIDEGTETVKTDVPNNDNYTSMDFLICFVVSETSKLHLFQQELESYCKSFESSLFLNFGQHGAEDVSEVFKDLENWYDINILYVSRCTKLFQLELASLINVGLLGGTLDIVGCENKMKEDINIFVDACSLSGLLNAPAIKESNHKLLEDMEIIDARENVKLTFSGSEFKFDMSDVCEVCNDWAKVMLDGEVDDPVFLKQVMENYKLKVIQDMNSLKRLLIEARTDHYALFRSYIFLSKCHSSKIVMEHIKQEVKASLEKDTCSIIQVLDNFITEKGGFSKILLETQKK